MVTPSYLASTEYTLTCGIMFFSNASWNNGGGGRSTARKRNGDTVDLSSDGRKSQIGMSIIHDLSVQTSVNIEFRLFVSSFVRAYEDLLRLHAKLSLESREDYTCAGYVSRTLGSYNQYSLEFFFFVPPRSMCKRLRNQPRNSTGSPCFSNENFPELARFTSCRNSCGLTWLLKSRGFHTFLASAPNLLTSSVSFPLKSDRSK